ncbi:DUF3040 domain-containing protein [Streptomyces griseoviridis]|uniref:DUF3040 domain-containing protein n=3 Tax=Streptomyces TaxID=1883 RepID=A0A918GQI8_STRGD|nr:MULTISPECIES: DUF3040 domain-containing protein [Streptomyces]MDP9684881.1 hypothetical protein [Streptomyces griseoviridis]GGS52583.1 hypothetical protein GCM10010238_47460 [Streptomyces niveoruber]GGT17373.1 hypothetical protein GCM10010240_58120 [Streptomyces griseoviridis]GGU46740.1 hypothetical protein GCM10010259_42100 [Streptomyces daghestanicus]GHI33643.1 hypothetical protein Sdagh_53730 [Streptomyces daghestanicus]
MSVDRLPEHEQRVLDEVERALRRDRRLDRQLRTFRASRRPDPARLLAYRPRTLTVLLLLALSVTLMVTGIVTSEPGVIWAYAATWPVTMFAAFRLLCRWTEG